MRYCIFDVETDALKDTLTKIHVLSYRIYEGKEIVKSGSITDYKQMADLILEQEIIVGHNIKRFDIPVMEKILGIKITAMAFDTQAISYYQYPISEFKHGLGAWGERLGYGKPVVEDYAHQPIAVYINRCEADVEITSRLFHFQMDYCMDIYGDIDQVFRLYNYLTYKMDCLLEQEEERIKLDVRLAEQSKLDLEFIIQDKIDILATYMPQVVEKEIPKKPYLQSGELSAAGVKWLERILELKLPLDTKAIMINGNPGSPVQLKDWLFSINWKPQTFKLNKKGEKIPQVSLPNGGGICPSIKEMFEEHPYLEELAGLFRARHRYGLFKSFLENKDDEDYIVSGAHGFTNTLRLQHSKPIANLPQVGKFYGAEVRGCLTLPDDSYLMCGSDISGLEDNTKQHYLYFYDPDYVTEMRVPGFDPHIDIAVLAGLISKDDEELFKKVEREKEDQGNDHKFESEYEAEAYSVIKKMRTSAKVINFSATYGAGPQKIAETLKCTLEFATKLHKTYWSRNNAIKKTAKACTVKEVRGQKWLYNPVSGFWMFLKAEKDRFSTLNQSTGVFVFDSWVRKVRETLNPLGIRISLQYHDEILLKCKKEHRDFVDKTMKDTMVELNKELGLNVDIGNSVEWGNNYADCH